MRVAVTTTARNLDECFRDWCEHHLGLVDRIYLWLDDPHERNSPHLVRDGRISAQVGAQSQHGSVHSNMMYRQLENAHRAIAHCLEQKIDWLIHIDTDELLYCPTREALDGALAPRYGLVTLLNHEVCPRWKCGNPFRECTWFKLNGKAAFNLYSNGKCAVRCRPGVWAPDAHSFRGYAGKHRTATEAVILHYACPSYDRWLAKYAALGDFPDCWWDDPKHNIPLRFHLDSRDIYKRCAAERCFDRAEAFWAAQVIVDPDLQRLQSEAKVARFSPLALVS